MCELHTSRNCCTISLSGVGCVCVCGGEGGRGLAKCSLHRSIYSLMSGEKSFRLNGCVSP